MNSMRDFKRCVEAFGGSRLFRKSALRIRDGAGVIESILGDRRYRTVLEIGTYRGVTAAFMASFCERVITIDLHRGRMERYGESFDRQAFWRAIGVFNVELKLVGSDDEKANLLQHLDFDFAFIDGDHRAPAPAKDFEMVRRCGAVLFHDYDQDQDNGVVDLVNTLPPHQVKVMDIFAFWQADRSSA